jgi:hypothetical protein
MHRHGAPSNASRRAHVDVAIAADPHQPASVHPLFGVRAKHAMPGIDELGRNPIVSIAPWWPRRVPPPTPSAGTMTRLDRFQAGEF